MKLACKDLSPETACTFVAEGDTADDAAKMMLAHARVNHTKDIEGMPDDAVIKAFAQKAHQ